MNPTTNLDVDELLQLALNASRNEDHATAITKLKQALEISPNNAKVLYLLGAEHAHIGLYERAIEQIDRAVRLDPDQATAVFQLGLLYITTGQVEKAINAWTPLDALGEDNCFYLFKTGM